jgi:hypothetical protein
MLSAAMARRNRGLRRSAATRLAKAAARNAAHGVGLRYRAFPKCGTKKHLTRINADRCSFTVFIRVHPR